MKPQLILELEKELTCFFKLVYFPSIYNYKQRKISEYSIDEKGNITGIAICRFELRTIPQTLKKLKTLSIIILRENQISDISPLKELKNTQTLSLALNQISDISPLKELKNIQMFDLSSNQISDISPLKELKNIKSLYLGSNHIHDISSIKELKNIQTFFLSNNQISDISPLKDLKNIQMFVLSSNQISDISPLKELKNIKKLDLSGNQISNISPLKGLSNIQELWLDSNPISDISPLKELRNIQMLRVVKIPITILHPWICDFPKMDINWDENWKIHWQDGSITFYDNPIENVPIEVIKKGKKAIKAFFEEQKKVKSIPNPYVKLILIGNTTVGKTSLINFLVNHTFNENQNSTHGVNPPILWKANDNLEVNIWDFGGQEYYHSTHQLFFSNNALYLLLFDKQHNSNGWLQTEIDYPDKGRVTEELEHFDYFYWLRNIRNLSDKSKILMVQNKVENIRDRIFPENQVFDENLEYKVDDYQSTSVLNAYNYFKENQQFSHEFEELQKLIIGKLNEVKRGEIFEYYLKSKELIETAAQTKPVVNIEEFIEICKPANENIANIITDADGNETEYTAWKLMCVYFHETGVLLHYPDSPTLKDKIFIRPTFVTDTIYKILNYKVKQAFGRFTFADALQSLDNNTELAHDMIELMSAPNFKLIFNEPEKPKCYVAPQYLDDKKPAENVLKHITKNMEIGFSLEFTNFLPKYILTEFMINYGRFQKDDIIWKYGIVFEKYGTTAFVECLFHLRKIVYKSDNSGESERLKYEVFESLRHINKNDKNLKIAVDSEHFYELDMVLHDYRNELFRLFREGYEKYKNYTFMTDQELIGYQENLELLIRKKNFLQKELSIAYDAQKQFALTLQTEDLEKQIAGLKLKVDETARQITQINIGNNSHNNLIISGVSNSTVTVQNNQVQLDTLSQKLDVLSTELKEMRVENSQHKTDILQGQKAMNDEIILVINGLTESQTQTIWENMAALFIEFEKVMDEKLQEQYQKIKSTSSLKTKLELSIPFIKLLGINFKTEFDVVGWSQKMYEKHELKIFKLFGAV